MGDNTAIEWADATWNPITGCSIVSPGCTNCYAMRQAGRLLDKPGSHYHGTTRRVNGKAVWTGTVAMAPDHILTAPLKWKKPRRIFVNSMGDLFHESVPDEWIDRVFAVMALCPQHTFLVLTKRSVKMRKYVAADRFGEIMEHAGAILDGPLVVDWPPPNVHLGVSCEDQARADERIPDLLATPAAVRFVSAEPLLGPIDFANIRPAERDEVDALTGFDFDQGGARERLDWVIAGGESGPDARPMHPDWARAIRDQCEAAGAAFFMKQMAKKASIPDDLLIRQFPTPREAQ